MLDAANVSQPVGLSVFDECSHSRFYPASFHCAVLVSSLADFVEKCCFLCVWNLAPYLLRRAGETFALRTRGDDEQVASIFLRFDGLSHFSECL